jgi:hypothetical protein
MSEPRPLEIQITISRLKRYESPGIDKILAELIQTGDERVCSEIFELIYSILNK